MISSLVQVLARPETLPLIGSKVSRPLDSVKAVAYYGCLLVRPAEVTGSKNPEDPQEMDSILGTIGVVLRPWGLKTFCCGGGLTLSRPDIVDRLTGKILDRARRAGAECIVTACPMCLTNLETRQYESVRAGKLGRDTVMPVVYFTELMALAMGMNAVQAWLGKHTMDPRPFLHAKGLA